MPPPPPRTRHPPAYNMAAHMARMQKLGRAHSHEGVTSYYTDTEDGIPTKKTHNFSVTWTFFSHFSRWRGCASVCGLKFSAPSPILKYSNLPLTILYNNFCIAVTEDKASSEKKKFTAEWSTCAILPLLFKTSNIKKKNTLALSWVIAILKP